MRTFRYLLAGLALATTSVPAHAQLIGDDHERGNTMQVVIREPGDGPVSRSITLPFGQAAVVHLPVDAADVMVANPNVVDAMVRTSTRSVLLGQGVGRTNIFYFDASGEMILDLDVRVERDMNALNDAIARYVPSARVTAESMNNNIVLRGTVPSASAADSVMQIAGRWADSPEQLVSFVSIEGREQVMLKVRIVEMERNVVRQLGINMSGSLGFGDVQSETGEYPSVTTFETNNGFGVAGIPLGGLSAGVVSGNIANGVLQSTIGANLDALERVGLVRTLAEPTLTAISGESGSFLAGGEFPVPTGRDRDGLVTVEFKPFGVGLGYTPVVLSEGRISLRLSTEVSELSNEGAISSGASTITDEDGNIISVDPGITLPSLTVNRAETTVEMPSGGSLVIAGLIKEDTRQALDSVPGIERIPLLGSLFRSRDFMNNETELVIVVTPYLVDPTDPDNLRSPGEGFVPASNVANLLFGRLNRVYAAPGADTDGQSWNGPVGFSLE